MTFIFRKTRRKSMYRILLKMKKMYNREDWMKMVDQAKGKGKLTDEEYSRLTEENDEATDH